MTSAYRTVQTTKAVKLINAGKVFQGGKGGKLFMRKERDFVLREEENNFYPSIYKGVIDYFAQNEISWWGGKRPTGHVLSSQIACLNHLFWLRHDPDAVLAVARAVHPSFIDVFEIKSDKEGSRGYIQFEAVSNGNYLNEGKSKRGVNCTSVDALIYAAKQDGSKWLIPIEWKYTESYGNSNKALEGHKKNPTNCKGSVRKKRYTDLINRSDQLTSSDHTCYYYEPFYQLMRQTLWAEQMIEHKNDETVKTDYFLHVHVVPGGNKNLLEKKYKCSGGKNMKETWCSLLKDQSKYHLVTPETLLGCVNRAKYGKEIEYLAKRYWDD